MFAFISNIFGYLLNFLYELVNNYGFAIILFSILLRIILLPITIKQQKSVQKTSKIQGQLKSLQLKYKNNPEMLNKETMELYKKENISPFSGCLSAIAQILIILSVFYLVSQPLTYMKKANDTNPEFKSVVDEYKEQVKNDSNNKSRYLEIATIARMRDDYDRINKELNQENIDNNESKEEVDVQNNSENEVNNDTVVEEKNEEVSENNEQIEESQKNENTEENKQENKQELQKRKEILEKLNINMDFVGLDLSKVPNENLKDYKVYIIPVLYVISSFISIKLTTSMQNSNKKKKEENGENKDDAVDSMAQMNKSMSYMMPIMTLFIAFIAPLGLALYWFISNVLMIAERFIINKIMDNKEA